ncbi:MAG: hypothetical protein KY469_14645 [Actinobacteria bacterium]|nr:hypothetical protein [Actinomycetota bacterium]
MRRLLVLIVFVQMAGCGPNPTQEAADFAMNACALIGLGVADDVEVSPTSLTAAEVTTALATLSDAMDAMARAAQLDRDWSEANRAMEVVADTLEGLRRFQEEYEEENAHSSLPGLRPAYPPALVADAAQAVEALTLLRAECRKARA